MRKTNTNSTKTAKKNYTNLNREKKSFKNFILLKLQDKVYIHLPNHNVACVEEQAVAALQCSCSHLLTAEGCFTSEVFTVPKPGHRYMTCKFRTSTLFNVDYAKLMVDVAWTRSLNVVLVQGAGGLGPDVATGDAIMVRRKMESLVHRLLRESVSTSCSHPQMSACARVECHCFVSVWRELEGNERDCPYWQSWYLGLKLMLGPVLLGAWTSIREMHAKRDHDSFNELFSPPSIYEAVVLEASDCKATRRVNQLTGSRGSVSFYCCRSEKGAIGSVTVSTVMALAVFAPPLRRWKMSSLSITGNAAFKTEWTRKSAMLGHPYCY
uniref:Predicted protein n=1 Tax=Physcomitrium patens TaxID=3218 RepID=A9U521_PHYPA